MNEPVLRAGRDDDAAGFIALLSECWLEYPGCVVDIDGESPELYALATYFEAQSGALWVAEQDGRVVGMIGTRPLGDDVWELCKVYAYANQRGTGLASQLTDLAEGHARARGATEMKLWTDTRFDRAHRFYEKRGYVRAGPIRVLNDLSNSLEFGYTKPLAGIVVRGLDAAAAASAVPALQRMAATPDFWRQAASGVALGSQALLLAWAAGELAGVARLDLAGPSHRAELHGPMVAPSLRRRGIGRRLLDQADATAERLGRTLLTAQIPDTEAARALMRGAGWTEAGVVPGFIHAADGTPQGMVLGYKSTSLRRTD